MIDDYEPDEGEYQIGDKVSGFEVLAYTVPKGKYEDIIDEWPLLLKDSNGKVFLGSIVGDRIYPFELSDYINETYRKVNKSSNHRKSIKESDSDDLDESKDPTKEPGYYGDSIFSMLDRLSGDQIYEWVQEYGLEDLSDSNSIDEIYSKIAEFLEDKPGYTYYDTLDKYFYHHGLDENFGKSNKSFKSRRISESSCKECDDKSVARKVRKSVRKMDLEEDDLGSRIDKYQKWVDYDMKRYGRVSDRTNSLIRKAGLQLIKDQYGDYEVSVGRYRAESVVGKSVEKQCKHKLKEDINSIEINSDDLSIEIDKSCDKCNKEQVIVPVSEKTKEEIEIGNIDKDTIEDAVEECLTESFTNVKFFKASDIIQRKNRFIVEGIIGFKSGKKRNTNFVFRPSLLNESKIVFRGFNRDLKESFKSISLNCKKQGNKIIVESYKVSK